VSSFQFASQGPQDLTWHLFVVEASVILFGVSVVFFATKGAEAVLHLHNTALGSGAVDVGTEAAVLLTHPNPSSHRGRG